jgi:hypothetical protein
MREIIPTILALIALLKGSNKMPSSPGYKRNYKKEYENYHSSTEQKKRRASRNAARRTLEKSGSVRKGDGKDVDHKSGNPKNNKRSNLSVKSKSSNRSYARTKTAGKKNKRS